VTRLGRGVGRLLRVGIQRLLQVGIERLLWVAILLRVAERTKSLRIKDVREAVTVPKVVSGCALKLGAWAAESAALNEEEPPHKRVPV